MGEKKISKLLQFPKKLCYSPEHIKSSLATLTNFMKEHKMLAQALKLGLSTLTALFFSDLHVKIFNAI